MMKKSILITLLAFGLVTGFLMSTVFAAEQTDQPKSEEKAEKGWQDALEARDPRKQKPLRCCPAIRLFRSATIITSAPWICARPRSIFSVDPKSRLQRNHIEKPPSPGHFAS